MIKKRLALGICVCACSFLLFGSMEASAFCYTATPSWSKSPLSSNVTFKATTVGGIEARGYYAFVVTALRETSQGNKLGNNNLVEDKIHTVYVHRDVTEIAVSSSVTYDNNKAKYGFAEYGISCDELGKQPVEGKHIAMEYRNIY